MVESTPERPSVPDSSTAWPSVSANSFRQQYMAPAEPIVYQDHTGGHFSQSPVVDRLPSSHSHNSLPPLEKDHVLRDHSSHTTPDASSITILSTRSLPADSPAESSDHDAVDKEGGFEPIKSSKPAPRREPLTRNSSTKLTEDELFKVLSRRRTNTSAGHVSLATKDSNIEQAEVERLMSRMFGRNRQENSEEEKTRHVGLVFKNVTVKGMGLGAALQGTLSDPFLVLPRLFKKLAGRGAKITSKPPIRTILDDFTGCVRPGEMLLVLGRPGSGCSTFLKILANQRFGYESVDGDVSYGGTDAKTMGKDYRGEIVYNPEDDLHYATLSVKRTLAFALKTRTPGKESRNEGESRADYVKEFLRVVSKLFWIEHTSPRPQNVVFTKLC